MSLQAILSPLQIAEFQSKIWDYFAHNRRVFPWRYVQDPYAVLVSEIMLQQTQTSRVSQKYEQFLATFPTFELLSNAPVRDVIACFQGLGYNRRALYLHQIAQKVVALYSGCLPDDPAILETFPGIGVATAASIVAFAFNKPTIFIETNIRTVFIHSFFMHASDVTDRQILPLVQATIDATAPRDWYYALMDYGAMLKKNGIQVNHKSSHYNKQSKFEGSDRQVRGAVLRHVMNHCCADIDECAQEIGESTQRVSKIVEQLIAEGFLKIKNGILLI